jgi:alpha-D-ribose 1-methylphosphonate 5-phosphate C-P lyase
MRDVCGRIAVFEENVVADEGNCIFLCFETSVGETKKHAVSP